MINTKTQIRKELLHKLYNQPKEEGLQKSSIIKKKLFSLAEFKIAKIVMLYVSMSTEVRTEEIIDEALGMGKRVVVPRCASRDKIVPKEITDRRADLEISTYGIYEPLENRKNVKLDLIDLVVIPGVAFDEENMRLGRGKGYYDRFLEKLPGGTVTVGLAFDFQIVKDLPQDSHDKPVSQVITN
ncbi:MAG: 5-formyltetrahydrofolate cyclo-ligase [Candidatus Omnitrophota bacterium]